MKNLPGTFVALGTALALAAAPAAAQSHSGHSGHSAPPSTRPAATPLSDRARAQIDTVRRAVAQYDTPEKARAAGFRPVFGFIPTMGTHWVSIARMRDGKDFDLETPDHLMFSRVDGEDLLVGVAYAYRGAAGAAPPDGFDGDADHWHDHPELAPRGETLTMLHVWFVPSPDGVFAGHNPWLGYHAAGVEPPDDDWVAADADARRARTLALALAESAGPTMLGEALRRFGGPDASREVERSRAAIRELIPALDSAHRAGDRRRWTEAADAAIAEWERIRSAYLAAVPMPAARERLTRFFDEMISGRHGR